MKRVVDRAGLPETNRNKHKRRLTGTLSLRSAAADKPWMANLDRPPRRRKLKAPATAGTVARAATSKAAEIEAHLTGNGRAAQ